MKVFLKGYKKIALNLAIYPLEAVVNTCYSFVGKYYFYLDSLGARSNKIVVYFKPKKSVRSNPSDFSQEFNNELLYSVLRVQLAKKHRRLREYIVGSALYSNVMSVDNQGLAIGNSDDKSEDPLGIGIPWEEKYAGKKD